MNATNRTRLCSEGSRSTPEEACQDVIHGILETLASQQPANEGESPGNPRQATLPQAFRASFVGGPLHGRCAYFDKPPPRIAVGSPRTEYQARTWIGDTGATIPYNWAAYAPVDMPVDAYLDLLRTIPGIQAGLAWLSRQPSDGR